MKKLPRYRVRCNRKGRAAWKDSSSVFLSAVAILLVAWGALPPEEKTNVLVSLGIDPLYLALISLIGTVVGGLIAKHTFIERVDNSEPEQHQEDSDHEG